MNTPRRGFGTAVIFLPLPAICLASLAYAQTPNPFQSLKDAVNKVIKQVPNQAQPPSQPGVSSPTAGAAPATAATTAATAATTPSSGSAQPWTPPADNAGAVPFKGPLDPSKLPDIGGVHIGDSSEQAAAALKKIHPGAPVAPVANSNGLPPTGITLQFGNYQPPPSWDNISVGLTFDSNQQTVYSVSRDVRYQPNINKQHLIDALREKYGKETGAIDESYLEAKSDAVLMTMWWLIDEQGHVQHPSRMDPNTHTPWGCQIVAGTADGSTYRTMNVEYVSKRLHAATFCDSLISITANFDRGNAGGVSHLDEVSDSRIMLFDAALMRRSAIAMGDAQMAKAHKQQQTDLKNAGEAKPNL